MPGGSGGRIGTVATIVPPSPDAKALDESRIAMQRNAFDVGLGCSTHDTPPSVVLRIFVPVIPKYPTAAVGKLATTGSVTPVLTFDHPWGVGFVIVSSLDFEQLIACAMQRRSATTNFSRGS